MAGVVKRVALALAGVLMMVSVPVQAVPAKAAAKPAAAGPRTIELYQALDAEQRAALQGLLDRFNASGADRIVLSTRGLGQGALPGMMIIDRDEAQRLLAGKPRLLPLHEVARKGGASLKALQAPAYVDPVLADAKGRLQGLPVGMSTPVMYYNKDVLVRAGVDPEQMPGTWMGMQELIGRLVDAGVSCPYTVSQPARVMIDNLSSWHNEAAVGGRGNPREVSFNGMLQVKHVALMASWHRANYLRIFGPGAEAENRFATGECAIVAAPSSSWPRFRRAAFPVGAAPLPYHDDVPGAPQNTVAEGPALWVAADKDTADYKVIARFVDFWLRPENQQYWEQQAGFLPLRPAGTVLGTGGGSAADRPIQVALSQLSHRPATASSRAGSTLYGERVRAIVEEELSGVWADTKPAKLALDNAVERALRLR